MAFHLDLVRNTESFLNAVFYGTDEELSELAQAWTVSQPTEIDPAVRFQEGREVPYPEDVAALLVTGQTGQALDQIQSVRERYANETIFRFGDLNRVAEEISSLGRESEVPTIYKLQAELWPQSLIAQYQAGEALYKAGRGDEATACYRMILELTEDTELEPGSQTARIRDLALTRLAELDPEALEPGEEASP